MNPNNKLLTPAAKAYLSLEQAHVAIMPLCVSGSNNNSDAIYAAWEALLRVMDDLWRSLDDEDIDYLNREREDP